MSGQLRSRISFTAMSGIAVWLFGAALAWMDLAGPVWGLTVYAVALIGFRWAGSLWPIFIPTIIVAAHTYPWTGSLLVSPADYIAVAAVGNVLLRHRNVSVGRPSGMFLGMMLIFAVFGCLLGAARLPASPVAHQLDLYLNRLNAMHVFKGYLIGLSLAYAFLLEWNATGAETIWRRLRSGIQLAAFVVAITVVVERSLGYGVFDFGKTFRSSGPIFSMHIGGQHIDFFWSVTLPFLLFARETKPTLGQAILGTIIQVLSIYAVFVTMSRALIVFAALLLVLAILITAFSRSGWATRIFGVLSFGVLVALMFTMWQSGQAVQDRFRALNSGFQSRLEHLRELAPLVADSNPVWGDGFGTYPLTFRKEIRRSESILRYCPQDESGPAGLQVVPGNALYLEQAVDISQPGPWTIRLKYSPADQTESKSPVGVSICEKTLLQSYACLRAKPVEEPKSEPNLSMLTLDVSELVKSKEENDLLVPRPTCLWIGAGREVRIHSIDVRDADGNAVVRNGDFSQGSRYWYFTCDDHLIWRTKNIWAHLRIVSGWIGVSLWLCFIGWIGCRSITRLIQTVRSPGPADPILRQRAWVGVTLLAGMVSSSMFGTLIDTPWILQLWFLLAASILATPDGSSQPSTDD